MVYSAVNDPAVLCDLMNRERVTISAGVPTVWLAMVAHIDATGDRPEHLKLATIGGSAAPRAMIARLMDMGIEVKHLWGMTETSPVATAAAPPPDWDQWSRDEQLDLLMRQGNIPYGVELAVIDEDGGHLPRDGKSAGRLHIRGPWVIQRYFGAEADAV
ncbi:AMP-binding protein, partial [Escherichia coli]|nr:AMP-binding protein [Escherichia coli]